MTQLLQQTQKCWWCSFKKLREPSLTIKQLLNFKAFQERTVTHPPTCHTNQPLTIWQIVLGKHLTDGNWLECSCIMVHTHAHTHTHTHTHMYTVCMHTHKDDCHTSISGTMPADVPNSQTFPWLFGSLGTCACACQP